MAGSGGNTFNSMTKPNDNVSTKSWSAIASMNTSKRNNTNTLEIRLENEEKKGCTLNTEEIERLLKRLKLQIGQFTSVQACPERRNVIFITLCPGVDINKFINHGNESFILKPGVRTTTFKHANKKEVQVQVFGLHPDTKNETVIRYLNAHGQVDIKSPVTYSVYPGVPGSTLLAGKRNGNRIYSMVIKRNIGSSHVIDGEKVSVRYPGQIKTCNNCQQEAMSCPGKGLAKDCSSERILLSDFMLSYWKKINYQPDTEEMRIDDSDCNEDINEPATIDQTYKKSEKVNIDSEMLERYSGVIVKGFRKETDMSDVVEILKRAGMPSEYSKEDLEVTEKAGFNTLSIDLKPEVCLEIVNNLDGEVKCGKKISVFPLVGDSPTKLSGEKLEELIEDTNNDSLVTTETSAKNGQDPNLQVEVSEDKREAPAKEAVDKKSTPKSSSGIISNLVNFWSTRADLEISSDDSETDSDEARKVDIANSFKRKVEGRSPDNDFGLSRKQRRKLQKAQNRSK